MANSYLTRTPSSTGNRRKFTFSAWVKFNFNQLANNSRIFSCGSATSAWVSAYINSPGDLQLAIVEGGTTYTIQTNRLFRDESAWYHLVFVVDTENATANNRLRIYVNGEEETSFSQRVNPTQDLDTQANTASKPIDIGSAENVGYSPRYFPGYMSHVAMVDGQVLTPTSFGETDSTSGIWKFKSPSGLSWGTNGFHLKFENSGALGTDSSGQGNTFTVQGNLKQAIDTPSDSYATLNGAFNLSDNVLSYGNNKVLNSNSNWKYVPATLGVESGKWYAEYKVNKSSGYIMNGVVDMQYATSQDKNSYTHSGAGTGSVSIYSDSGEKYIAGSNTTYAGTYTTNDIIGVALDMDNSKVYFSKNGAWANGSGGWGSSTFDAAVGAISLPTTGTYTFAVSQRSGAYNEVNFGNGLFGITAISSAGSNGNGSLFEYDVPSGYYALNTKNLNTYG